MYCIYICNFLFFYSVCVCLVFLWLCSRIAQCLRSIKLMFCCKIGTRCIVITKCIHRGRGIWILTSLWETLWNATHKQVAFSYFSFVPLSSHLLLSIHQNNSEDYFWVFILLVRMGVIMIKDLGFFFFFHNLLWVLPLSSKQRFDQLGFWFVQVWSCLHVKANWKVLSFSHLCHSYFFFFYFSWCGLLHFFFFFNLLLLVLCFKNSTLHICLKRIEDAHFFLHLVTYACNTLMYF